VTTTEIRFSEDAESAVIGIAMTFARAVPQLVADLSPADFYRPAHAAAFAAIVELHLGGYEVDVTTVADVLRRSGQLEAIGGGPGLLGLTTGFSSVAATPTFIAIIRREAAARQLVNAIGQARHALAEQVDPYEVRDSLTEQIEQVDRGGKLPERYWRSSKDYLATDHTDTTTPLAEGVCYPLSRIMIIASEKAGKSVLCRSIAYCFAAGIHPFNTRLRIDPVPTLIFDAENDDDELTLSMPRIRACVEAVAGPDAPWPATYSVPYGVDLEKRRDRSYFESVLQDFRPRLIVGGPVYKLTDQTKDMSEDRRAAIVQGVFNDVRKRWGSAVILEHHAPTGTGKGRPMKAKGGQVWPAWVNATFSLHSEQDGQSVRVEYPHPPRGKYRWPKRFDKGRGSHDWPWTPVLRHSSDYATPLPLQPEIASPPDDWKDEPF
jgi:DnaB-like helicase N terminal domain/AAA domain